MLIGSGHAVRCLTLANVLRARGAETCFIGNIELDYLAKRIVESGHLHIELPASGDLLNTEVPYSDWLRRSRRSDAELCSAALQDFNTDWLVVDHYALQAEWERQMAPVAKHVMVIDDLADRPHECQLLLDQNFRREHNGRYAALVSSDCRLLLGPRFALLQPEYARLHRLALPRVQVERILVYFGGGDPDGQLTAKSLSAAQIAFPTSYVDVVYPYDLSEVWRRLEAIAARTDKIILHRNLPSLAQLISSADLAIGAAGASSWERLCLGLPAVTAVCADNQNQVANEMQAAGLIIDLGPKDLLSEGAIESALQAVKAKDLSKWSKDCLGLCDGQGAEIVANVMYGQTDP